MALGKLQAFAEHGCMSLRLIITKDFLHALTESDSS